MLIDDPVEGMIRGDLLPFEELFKLYHGKVYALCLRMTGSPVEAEDLRKRSSSRYFVSWERFAGKAFSARGCTA